MATSSFPKILTRSVVPSLSEGLDAGDILECYALVRPATLHNTMMSDASMTIHKVAIGLRYRPLTVNDPTDEGKIREITLEYGPARMGASSTQESVPSVQVERSAGGGQKDVVDLNLTNTKAFVTWENEGRVYYTTQISSAGYVGAYYMASVTGAVLGKILEKAVEYPMENAYIRGRPRRYQPFVVVDGNNGLPPPGYEGERVPKRKVLLRSSGSSDFMEYMWYTLAELGVSLHPILSPPTYEVQLLATGVEKVKVGPPTWVTQSAAKFYTRLYRCIEAKVTGDYSRFSKPPTPSPTTASPAPSQAPSTIGSTSGPWIDAEAEGPSSNSTESDESDDETQHKYDEDDNDRTLRADFPGTPEVKQTDPPIDALKDIEDLIHDDDNSTSTTPDTFSNDTLTIPSSDSSDQPTNETESGVQSAPNVVVLTVPPTAAPTQIETEAPFSNLTFGNLTFSNLTLPDSATVLTNETKSTNATFAPISSLPSASPTNSAPSAAPSMTPSMYKVNKQDTKSEVDEAQQAADQAKQAAAEAKDAAKTDVDTKAADAAQAAAQAAQKAADATSTAAAQAAMEALLSGDGNAIVSVVSPCLSDPQFGIAIPGENGTQVTQAYLYLDGSSYYRVNLTYPYIQVVPVEHTLPQPRDFASTGSGGDFVDWTLAFLLLLMFMFGLLMLIQQVFGGYVKLIRPLFDFQIWFFDPRHYEEVKDNMEEERRMTESERGRGRAYSFGEDAIPVSMGGRRSVHLQPTALQLFRRKSQEEEDHEDEGFRERIPLNGSGEHQEEGELKEIEMTEAKASPSRRGFDESHRGSSRGSHDSGDSYSSLHNVDNNGGGSTNVNGVVGNMDLVKKDHRIREKDLPKRLSRDPDLVDMPNLKSSSKVAVPVGVKRSSSFGSVGDCPL